MAASSFDLIGVGSPIMDVVARVPDEVALKTMRAAKVGGISEQVG